MTLQVGHARNRLAEGASTAESAVSNLVDGASRCSFDRPHQDPVPWQCHTIEANAICQLLLVKPGSAVYALQGVERWSAEHRLACERDAAAGGLTPDPRFYQNATAGERSCSSMQSTLEASLSLHAAQPVAFEPLPCAWSLVRCDLRKPGTDPHGFVQFQLSPSDNKIFAAGGIRIVDGRVWRRPLPADAAAHKLPEEHLFGRLTSFPGTSSAATAAAGRG